MMKIRLFGSPECEDCKSMKKYLEEINFPEDIFEYVNAWDYSEEIQDFCDENEINELPHLQLIEEGEEDINFIGTRDVWQAIKLILEKLIETEEKKEKY